MPHRAFMLLFFWLALPTLSGGHRDTLTRFLRTRFRSLSKGETQIHEKVSIQTPTVSWDKCVGPGLLNQGEFCNDYELLDKFGSLEACALTVRTSCANPSKFMYRKSNGACLCVTGDCPALTQDPDVSTYVSCLEVIVWKNSAFCKDYGVLQPPEGTTGFTLAECAAKVLAECTHPEKFNWRSSNGACHCATEGCPEASPGKPEVSIYANVMEMKGAGMNQTGTGCGNATTDATNATNGTNGTNATNATNGTNGTAADNKTTVEVQWTEELKKRCHPMSQRYEVAGATTLSACQEDCAKNEECVAANFYKGDEKCYGCTGKITLADSGASNTYLKPTTTTS